MGIAFWAEYQQEDTTRNAGSGRVETNTDFVILGESKNPADAV